MDTSIGAGQNGSLRYDLVFCRESCAAILINPFHQSRFDNKASNLWVQNAPRELSRRRHRRQKVAKLSQKAAKAARPRRQSSSTSYAR